MEREELLNMGIDEENADRIIDESVRMREEYEEKIRRIEKDGEIKVLLHSSGAKNIKAVRALLDEDADDIKEQIERLKKNRDTSFLFDAAMKRHEPGRRAEKLPDVGKCDFEGKLSDARKRGDTLGAIRIKQQAASEGIMLL